MSSHVYEIVKTIYNTPASESTDSARVAVLQNTLIQLRLANIATLDAIMTHFTRLIELTSADETYASTLAQALASCVLRPRAENSLTREEKHSYRLIRDLFVHKNEIFSELKRASSLSHSATVASRPRAVSTNESNRKANMEARNRAILAAGGSRSRATSPGPSPRGHRRDRSSGGPETRFPIQTSPTVTTDSRNSRGSLGSVVNRTSLEIPVVVDPGSSTTESNSSSSIPQQTTNGSAEPNSHAPIASTDILSDEAGVEKRNSLGRSGHAGAGRLAQARKPPGTSSLHKQSVGSIEQQDSRRVSLTDKPMDD